MRNVVVWRLIAAFLASRDFISHSSFLTSHLYIWLKFAFCMTGNGKKIKIKEKKVRKLQLK